MKQKTRIIIYIAIAVTVLALGILAVLSASKGAAESADKHIDLGNKYLIELSYDKAVIEFNKAIEIEPRNADAYLGLAEAYIGLGDEDKAVDALKLGYENTGDERIKKKLDELLGVTEETSVTAALETTTTKPADISENGTFIDEMVDIYVPIAFYYGSEGLDNEYQNGYVENIYTNRGYEINMSSQQADSCHISYKISDELPFEAGGDCDGPVDISFFKNNDSIYLSFNLDNDNNDQGSYPHPEETIYDKDGNIIKRAENEYDSENKLVKCTVYNSDNKVIKVKELIYDENGLLNRIMQNDTLLSEYFYDDKGNKIKSINYSPDGKKSSTDEWQYDTNNNCVSNKTILHSSNYTYEYIWEYDSSGNRIKETFTDNNGLFNEVNFDTNGNTIKSNYGGYEHKYEYDSYGRRIKSYYDNTISTYEYNSDGYLTKKKYEHKDDEDFYFSITDYIYDSNGNVAKETRQVSYSYSDISDAYTQETAYKYEYGPHGMLTKKYEYLNNELYKTVEIEYTKIAVPSIFIEQIKNEYGIDLAE